MRALRRLRNPHRVLLLGSHATAQAVPPPVLSTLSAGSATCGATTGWGLVSVPAPARHDFVSVFIVESLEHDLHARLASLTPHRQRVLHRVEASIRGLASLGELIQVSGK
jgi:hypothetical protein